tara:strand:- start:26481 stop:26960 length:480 start_codon:yes stop_codon:yes gene_type:complete
MNTITPNDPLSKARAAYTAAMTAQEENEARCKDALQAKFDAENTIKACEDVETSLAAEVARTAEAYLKATRELNTAAVEAVEEAEGVTLYESLQYLSPKPHELYNSGNAEAAKNPANMGGNPTAIDALRGKPLSNVTEPTEDKLASVEKLITEAGQTQD